MLKYQDVILETLVHDALTIALNVYTGDMRDVIVTQTARFANSGRLIAHHPSDMRTLATLDYDFQTHRVGVSLNESVQPGQPVNGPRRAGLFHWTPGDPGDDHELARLHDEWKTAIREAIIAELAPKHADYYRDAIAAEQP